MDFYLALILGFAAAAIGGELFVRGAVGLARSLRISAGIIGAAVAAFATSSPELTVSMTAALAGSPQIALGSNIVNHRYWLFAIVIMYIAVIIFFSSGRNSVIRTAPIFVRALEPLFPHAASMKIVRLYILIRKGFHVATYALLAFLTSAAFYNSGIVWIEQNWQIYSFVVVLCVASADETLQYFAPDRVGSVRDVLLDCVGGLGAIIFFWIFTRSVSSG